MTLILSIVLIYFIVLVKTLIFAIKRHKPICSKVIQLLIIVIIFIGLILFEVSHATYYKYNDWWIKGRHISEVTARYGKLDKDFGHEKGYFISDGNTWIMLDHQPQYYWMVCDDNEIVYEIFVSGCPGG